MSESKKERRAGRAERVGPGGGASATPAGPAFSVVAAGENVVLVNTHTGQSWAMASDGGRPVWHPVAFDGSAARAPRRSDTKKAETSED